MHKKNVVIGMLLGATFTLIGLGTLGYGVYERRMGQQSLDWPTTDGEVVESRVASTSGDGTIFYPVIRYQYHVGDDHFDADRIRFAAVGRSTGWFADEMVEKYPVGSTARVYYNPASPDQAVLLPGAFARSWGLMGAGLAFLLFAMFSIRFALKEVWGGNRRESRFMMLGARR